MSQKQLTHGTAEKLENELSGHILEACYHEDNKLAIRIYGFAHYGLMNKLQAQDLQVLNIMSDSYTTNWPTHFKQKGICLIIGRSD